MKNAAKVVKQSLCDWSVTIAGKHIAWITKRDGLYFVKFSDMSGEFPYKYLAEAKEFAVTHA